MRQTARVAAAAATIATLTLTGAGTAHAATDPGIRKNTTKTRVLDRESCRYRVPGGYVVGNLVLLEHSRGGKVGSRTATFTWTGLRSVRNGATTTTTFPHSASLTRAYRDGTGRESTMAKKTRGRVNQTSLTFTRTIHPKKPVRVTGHVAWTVAAKVGAAHMPPVPLRCSLMVSAKPAR